MKINKDITFLEKNIIIKVNKNNCLCIQYEPNSNNRYVCAMRDSIFENVIYNKKTIQLYEIIFDKDFYNKIKNIANDIPDDIKENCEMCLFYRDCSQYNKMIINYKKTNQKIKEFKKFIQNIEEIDN